MSPRSKKEYLEAIHARFKKSSRKEKSVILDEFCATCGHHRKHAIRLLKGFKRYVKPKHKKRGRPASYCKKEILTPLKRIWLNANLPCSRRLKALLPLWIPGYEQLFGKLSDNVTDELNCISQLQLTDCLKKYGLSTKGEAEAPQSPAPYYENKFL